MHVQVLIFTKSIWNRFDGKFKNSPDQTTICLNFSSFAFSISNFVHICFLFSIASGVSLKLLHFWRSRRISEKEISMNRVYYRLVGFSTIKNNLLIFLKYLILNCFNRRRTCRSVSLRSSAINCGQITPSLWAFRELNLI